MVAAVETGPSSRGTPNLIIASAGSEALRSMVKARKLEHDDPHGP